MDQNTATQNTNNERQISALIDSYEAKLKKLRRRQDPAAQFARAQITAWRDRAQGVLKAHRTALSEYEATTAAFDAARFGLEQKRAELMAEVEKQLAPLVQRQSETAQAYEATARRVSLGRVEPPFTGRDAGDTSRIAELAHVLPDHIRGESNPCRDLVLTQRTVSVGEMVYAIAAEADSAQPDPRLDVGATRATDLIAQAFALRWRTWASANGVDPGPALQPAAAE